MRGRLLIDTNLLVLLLVGSASRAFIATHKRTRGYTVDDFDGLAAIVHRASKLLTTPTILSETSNLIRQFGHPHLASVIRTFRIFVETAAESYTPSERVARQEAFGRLGLTDAAILDALEGDATLLTDDLDLYLASALVGRKVMNFTHERQRWLR